MAQDLYYIAVSQSLTLVNENGNTNNWGNVSSLEISGSGYDAPVSGSEFIGTVGTARIYAYSGSTLLVSFPLEETNIYYNNVPNSIGTFISASFVSLDYIFNADSSTVTGSYFLIYDSTISASLISSSNGTGSGGTGIIAEHSYMFEVSGSGSYDAYLYINNLTSGSNLYTLSSSNQPISTSFNPVTFNDYQVTLSLISIV